MTRLYLGKPIKDIEASDETIIDGTLIKNKVRNTDKQSFKRSVEDSFESNCEIDDFVIKRS